MADLIPDGLKTVSPNLEVLAKGVALFATVGLGLAFLYDAVFFRTLDGRLARLLVMSDHIEAAVFTLPLTILAGVSIWFAPYLYQIRFRPWVAPFLLTAVLILVLIPAFLGWVLWSDVILISIIATVGTAAISMFAKRYMFEGKQEVKAPFPSGIKPQALIGYTLGVFVLVTLLLAYGAAKAIRDGMAGRGPSVHWFTDSVWLNNMSSVTGMVVRVIDRGAIVAKPGVPMEFLFIPKEQIRRVEFRE
jgi:hypothetical protein